MPVIKHSGQRVGVFIDTQNLYHSAKHLHASRADFKAILDEAVAGRNLIRALAYVISTPMGAEHAFFNALNALGIEIRKKEIREFGVQDFKRASWDVEMTLDAIRMAPRLDAIVIVSGDGSFAPLVEFLKSTTGIQTEVIAFGRSCAQTLKDEADSFLDLSESPERYLMNNPRREKLEREWNYGRHDEGGVIIEECIAVDPECEPGESDTQTQRAFTLGINF